MDEKDFVSYETARKLKAAGYSEKCSSVWHFDGEKANFIEDYPATFHGEPNDFNNSDVFGLCIYSAPTLWQAQKWLRVKRGMHCQVILNGVRSMYFWQVRELVGNGKYADSTHQYDVYEDAMIDCIDAALELITNKTE